MVGFREEDARDGVGVGVQHGCGRARDCGGVAGGVNGLWVGKDPCTRGVGGEGCGCVCVGGGL
jgi:hypothetical protein